MNLNNITVVRFTREFTHDSKPQEYTFYALAKDGVILMDTWSDGSETPTWWESKPDDIQSVINARSPEMIDLLTETPEARAERIAKRETSYREFMAAIDRNVSEVVEIG